MNFLAHLWLADRAGVPLAGGVLGDVLRGKLPATLPAPLALSVRLHRRIDVETDHHPRVSVARARFEPGARRYAGILLDLLYDHVLAQDWATFSVEPLPAFADRAAQAVADAGQWFTPMEPPRAPRFAALLLSYGTEAGLKRAVERTARRLRKPQGLLDALGTWQEHRATAGADLKVLLPDLERAARAFVAAAPPVPR